MNKVLVVVAHPDDEVIGCGGTIARHVKNGETVQVVFLADGFGSRDGGAERSKPASDAAIFLGCNPPIFLNLPDNQLDTVPLLDIVKKVGTIVSRFKPDIVYTHNFGDLNIDHQITHRAVITACRPEPGFCVKEIYSFEVLSATHWQSHSMGVAFVPNYFVNISDYIGLKIRALRFYHEEMRDYPHIRSYDSVENLSKFRASLVGIENAEAFYIERLIK